MSRSENPACSPECAIPEWAKVTKPHELAFYRDSLEWLNKTLYGIDAIAKTIHNMEAMNACDPGAPDWWGGYLSGGLLTAIERLAMHGQGSLEFMLERADKFAPKDGEAIND